MSLGEKRKTQSDSSRLIGGRYQVLRTLSASVSGRTFLVSDRALPGEKLALKLFHPRLLQKDEDVHALRRAILASRQLSHANIIRLFDFDRTEDDEFYVTSEFLEGESLSNALIEQRGTPLPIPAALTTLLHIARGLSYAHGKGVLHLDLRPENVILGTNGEVKLSEFGISKSLMRDRGLTNTGDLLGEARFMAPEQLIGGVLSQATDVYSFGLLAFELFGGRLPFTADQYLRLVDEKLEDNLTPLREIRADAPVWCEDLIRDCISGKPTERLQDGAALLERIEKNLVSAPSLPPNVFLSYFRRRLKRKTWSARIAITACCSVVLLLFLLSLIQREERIMTASTVLRIEKLLNIQLDWMKSPLGINGSLLDHDSLANAVRNGDHDTIEALLEAGSDPYGRTRDGKRILDILLAEGDARSLYIFLDQHVSFNGRDPAGNTPLLYALKNSNYRLLHHLRYRITRIDQADTEGVTPLILAAQRNENELVRMLVTTGSGLEARDHKGLNALQYAIRSKNLLLVEFLLKAGSRTDIRDATGLTPLFSAAGTPELTKLLLRYGADPFVRDNEGSSPLHEAAKMGDIESARLLIEAGAPVEAVDNSGKKAKDYVEATSAIFPLSSKQTGPQESQRG